MVEMGEELVCQTKLSFVLIWVPRCPLHLIASWEVDFLEERVSYCRNYVEIEWYIFMHTESLLKGTKE